MQLTTCYLSGLLAEAKEAHTRYMERFAIEGVEPPEHKWEDWYARFIMQKIKDREYNELFTPVDISCKLGVVEQVAANKEFKPKPGDRWEDGTLINTKDAWRFGL